MRIDTHAHKHIIPLTLSLTPTLASISADIRSGTNERRKKFAQKATTNAGYESKNGKKWPMIKNEGRHNSK